MSRTVSKSNALSTLCAVAFLGICAVLVLSSGRVLLHQTSTKSATAPSGVPNLLAAPAGPTLIVYILSFADSSYLENFQFFYREAILRDPDSRYDVLVAEDDFQELPLPPLPPHARYVRHGRGWCGGLGLVRWYLGSVAEGRQALAGAARLVLASSAVRGPFIPPGLRAMVKWHASLGVALQPPQPQPQQPGASPAAAAAASARSPFSGAWGSRSQRHAGADLAGGVVSCVQPQPQPQPAAAGPAAAGGSGGGSAGDAGGGSAGARGGLAGQEAGAGGGRGEAAAESEAESEAELLPPFLEFTALAATRAAVEVLLQLPEAGPHPEQQQQQQPAGRWAVSGCPAQPPPQVAAAMAEARRAARRLAQHTAAAAAAAVEQADAAAAAAAATGVAAVAAAVAAAAGSDAGGGGAAADGAGSRADGAEGSPGPSAAGPSRAAGHQQAPQHPQLLGAAEQDELLRAVRAAHDPAAVLAGEARTAAAAAAMSDIRAWCGALLAAGRRLAAAAARQRGVDWADRRTWRCNAGVSPLADHANDGHSLSPYEALFVPLGRWDDAGQPYGSPAELAAAYSEWMAAGAGEDAPGLQLHGSSAAAADGPAASPASRTALAARNRYFAAGTATTYKLPAVLFAVALGEQCFDADHFKQVNPDMAILPNRDLWKFWVFVGQFQPRGFRLRCGMDWSRFGLRNASGAGGGAAGSSGAGAGGKGG